MKFATIAAFFGLSATAYSAGEGSVMGAATVGGALSAAMSSPAMASPAL